MRTITVTVTQEHFDRAERGGEALERLMTCPNSLAVCDALGLPEGGSMDAWTGTTGMVYIHGRHYYDSRIFQVQRAFDWGFPITLPVSYELDLDAPTT